MALSKKQVKQLRAMANQLNPLLYIGKKRPDRRRGEAGIGDDGQPRAAQGRRAGRLRSDGEGGRRQARRPDRRAGGAGHRQPVRAVPQELATTTSSTSASYASDGGRIPRARIWLWPPTPVSCRATTIFSARAGHFFNDSVIVISDSSKEMSNIASPVLLHVPWSIDSL